MSPRVLATKFQQQRRWQVPRGMLLILHALSFIVFSASPCLGAFHGNTHANPRRDTINHRHFQQLCQPIHLLPQQYGTACFANRKEKPNNDDDNDTNLLPLPPIISDRVAKADPLEIRLDATLSSCYVLCRFLIYDISTGAKSTPGWELIDLILLLQTTSSAIVLSLCWTLAGLVTRNFEDGSSFEPLRVISTTVLAAPLWILFEIAFQWPTAGVDYANGVELGTIIGTGSIGLGCIMLLGRAFTSGWR